MAPDSAATGPTGHFTVFVALFSCAFLWPSLGAVNGDGLHLAFLWLAAMSGAFLWRLWQTSRVDVESSVSGSATGLLKVCSSPDGLVTVGLTIFLFGVWLSTWNVFRVSGDRRAALNLAFEWTAISACACLCRIVAARLACRRSIVNLIAGVSVGLAVYGIWQKHHYYPTTAKAYLEQRQILEAGTNPSEAAKIQQEFLSKGILLDGPARELFEKRLLHSTEPFGPFALANTLAGILAVGFVLLSGRLVSEWRSREVHWKNLVVPLIVGGIVAWCLILTKSRTAWVGTGVGMSVLLMARHTRSQRETRSILGPGAHVILIIGVSMALLLTIGFLTGVIDREVVLESPRSLQFRTFYWTGAAGVVGDEPLFGAGPGNFRQLYLAHKPLESSESIQDPHNFLLDAWCFAGVIGFSGMLLIVAGVMRAIRPDAHAHEVTARPESVLPVAGLFGCLVLHFGWRWLSGATLESQDTVAAATIVVAGIGFIALSKLRWNRLAPSAACVTLLVHMLGAGGLQITTLWILLFALVTTAVPLSPDGRSYASVIPARIGWMLGAVIWAAAAAATVYWGLTPVLESRLHHSVGQQRLRVGDKWGALHAFELAAVADPLSPTMRQHIVKASAYSLMQRDPRKIPAEGKGLADDDIKAIESACASYIQSDTRAIDGRLTRARIYHQLYRLTDQSGYIESCVDDFRQVVARHPTNALLQLELALYEEAAGYIPAALETAQKAKNIETVNHVWGHSDQYLSEDQRKTLDRIINGGRQ